MKKLLVATLLCPLLLHGKEPMKTLSPSTYQKLDRGKHLDKVWMSPEYEKNRGFKTVHTQCVAEAERPSLVKELDTALAPLCKSGSSHRLELKITLDETRTGYAHFVVEGHVMDAENRSLAAFAADQNASDFLKAPNYADACKKLAQKIASDML